MSDGKLFLIQTKKKGAANIYRLDLERTRKKAVIDTYVSTYVCTKVVCTL